MISIETDAVVRQTETMESLLLGDVVGGSKGMLLSVKKRLEGTTRSLGNTDVATGCDCC